MYLLFVLLATIMWFTNAFSTRREITVTMPVSYTHIPDDYILSDAPVAKIRVTLEDEGVDLFANRNRHYELAFDLSNYIHGEEGSFVISMDEVRQVIVQQLAGDAALMSFTPETLSGTYTRQHEKQVPIVFVGQVKPAAQHQLCSEVELSPSTARVYGTEQDLASIDYIETALTEYEGVTDSFSTRLPLIVPKGLRIVPDSVGLHIVAEQFTENAIQRSICTPDLHALGQTIHLFPSQATVTYRIGTTRFASVAESDFDVYVELPEAGTDRLPVRVECHNPYITHIRVKPVEVEYLIENYDTHSDGGSAASVPED